MPSLLKVKYEWGSVRETNFPMGKLPTTTGTAVGAIVDVAVGTTVGCAVGIGSAVGAQAVTTSNPTTINRWNKRSGTMVVPIDRVSSLFSSIKFVANLILAPTRNEP